MFPFSKRVSEVLPRRQSLRIQNLDPEGGLLPDKPPVDRFGYSALDESEVKVAKYFLQV